MWLVFRPLSRARLTCQWMSTSPTRQASIRHAAPSTGRGADAPAAFLSLKVSTFLYIPPSSLPFLRHWMTTTYLLCLHCRKVRCLCRSHCSKAGRFGLFLCEVTCCRVSLHFCFLYYFSCSFLSI
jgi:hypothetical protein